jgi:hypothetical protein
MMQDDQGPAKTEYGIPPRLWRRLAEPVDCFDVGSRSGVESTPVASTHYTGVHDVLQQVWHRKVFVCPP